MRALLLAARGLLRRRAGLRRLARPRHQPGLRRRRQRRRDLHARLHRALQPRPTAVALDGWSSSTRARRDATWRQHAADRLDRARPLLPRAGGAGAGGTTLAPDADATADRMAARAGKVALVDGITTLGCNGGSTPCDCRGGSRGSSTSSATATRTSSRARAAPTLDATRPRPALGRLPRTPTTTPPTSRAGAPDAAQPRARAATPADAAPSSARPTPPTATTEVPLDANVAITFSEPVDRAPSAFAITCATSGDHTRPRRGRSGRRFTFDPAADFARNETAR